MYGAGNRFAGIVVKKKKNRIVGFVLLLIVVTSAPVVHAGGADVLVARGIEKISARDYEGAVELLAAALEMAPDDPEANFFLGFSYVRLGRYEEAEEYLLETTRLDPREAEACFELGLLYSYSSQCEQAEKYFAKFAEMSDDEDKKQRVPGLSLYRPGQL